MSTTNTHLRKPTGTHRSNATRRARNVVTPTRRDLSFGLPAERICSWHPLGAQISVFMNTLSIFFPAGERFFIDSVRHYRDAGDITDPELLESVRAFIGQEAMHGREHEAYNAMLDDAGLPAAQLEGVVIKLLDTLNRHLPPAFRLSATTALEHWTAVMGGFLLEHPEMFEGVEPAYRDMWFWHALEETEHKAVAFDVYREAVGDDLPAELIRATGMVVATGLFWTLVFSFHPQMMAALRRTQTSADDAGSALRRDKRGLRARAKGWIQLARFAVGDQPGFMRRLVPELLAYFRPGFHPWDQDNRHHLAMIDTLEKRYAA